MHNNKQKKHKKKEDSNPLTTEKYVYIVKRIGFSVAELEFFDVGDVIDVAYEFTDEQGDVRQATQEDFDRF